MVEGCNCGMESSTISKKESLNEDISEAFLFILLTTRGLTGVPWQGCCLWQDVWKVDLQAKHLIGLEGFFRGLLQWAQLSSGKESLPELLKLPAITAWLKAEMS